MYVKGLGGDKKGMTTVQIKKGLNQTAMITPGPGAYETN